MRDWRYLGQQYEHMEKIALPAISVMAMNCLGKGG